MTTAFTIKSYTDTENKKLDNTAMLIIYPIQKDIESTLEKLYPGDSELIDETYLDKRIGVQMSVECIENDDNVPEIWVTEDVEVFSADTGETLVRSSERLHKNIIKWIESYNAYTAKDYSLAKFDCVTPNY